MKYDLNDQVLEWVNKLLLSKGFTFGKMTAPEYNVLLQYKRPKCVSCPYLLKSIESNLDFNKLLKKVKSWIIVLKMS